MTTKDAIKEIVDYAMANKLDAIELVQDYFLEKDSRLSRKEVEGIVKRAVPEWSPKWLPNKTLVHIT